MIKTGTFYKARDMRIGDRKLPGGYLYVYLVGTAADLVIFRIAAEPKTELLTGGTFAVSREEFLRYTSTIGRGDNHDQGKHFLQG